MKNSGSPLRFSPLQANFPAKLGLAVIITVCVLSLATQAQDASPTSTRSSPAMAQSESTAPPALQAAPDISALPDNAAAPLPPAMQAAPPADTTEPKPEADIPAAIDTHAGTPVPGNEDSDPGLEGNTGAATDAGSAATAHIPARYDVNHIGDRGVGKGLNFYSYSREIAMGRQLANEIDTSVNMVKDPLVFDYVNRLAQDLVRNSDALVPFTVKVIDDNEINAFALPGGFFYVNSGLVLAAENEAELAGVMAHEIAHVAARHATRNATKMQIFNMAAIPMIFATGPAGMLARQAMSIAMPLSFLKFSRDAEREADLLGLQYTYAAGYDPAEFVHFFETLRTSEREKVSHLSRAFATHPLTRDRIMRAQKEIETMLPARADYIVTTSDFDQVKRRLAALEASRQIEAGYNGGPVLRRRLGHDPGNGNDSTADESADRPTLRKR